MNGTKILLDTNAVLQQLTGRIDLGNLIKGTFLISFVTELELLSFPDITKGEENIIQQFLKDIEIIDLFPPIKEHTIKLRRKYKIKLPDAIICATAFVLRIPLITFDKSLLKVKEVRFKTITK